MTERQGYRQCTYTSTMPAYIVLLAQVAEVRTSLKHLRGVGRVCEYTLHYLVHTTAATLR